MNPPSSACSGHSKLVGSRCFRACAITSCRSRTKNVVAPTNSACARCAAIAANAGGRPPVAELPPGLTRGLGRTLETIAALRGRAPLLSEEMALQSTLRVRVSSAAAERELGYRPRPAREAIAASAAWYRAQGLLD